MDFNQELLQIFDEELNQKISEQITEDPAKIQKAVKLNATTLLAGLFKRSTTDIGLKQLHQILTKHPNEDIELLKSSLKSSEETKNFIKDSEITLSLVLPSLKSALTQLTGSQAGTRNSSSSALIGMSMRVLLEKLSQRLKNENWDKADLAHFLEAEYNNVKKNISPELFDKINGALGLRAIQQTNRPKVSITPIERRERNVVENKSSYAATTTDIEEESTPIAIPWKTMGIILGLGLLLAAAYWGFNEYQNRPVSIEPEEEITASVADSNVVKTDTLNAVVDSTKQVIQPKEVMSSFGTNLDAYLADSTTKLGRTFVLTNVDFLGGTPQLDGTSTMILEELTTVLKKYPTSQIKLVGYANDGSQTMGNKTLSTKRVFAIKQKLIANGIDLLRINAIGLGDGVKRDSLNLNATDRGSRRIDMKVVKK